MQAVALVGLLIAEWIDGETYGRRFAGYAAVSWLVLLNVPNLAHTAMTDMQSAAWLLLAALAQFRFRRPVLAGLLWGGALGYKYQAVIFLLAAVIGEVFVRPAAAGGQRSIAPLDISLANCS